MVDSAGVQLARIPRESPELRERVQALFSGLSTGPWSRWIDARWLGAYTPADVPMWIRKLMRRDPQIKLGLMALKAPFFGIDFSVKGGNRRTRAFVQTILLDNQARFKRLLWSILNALDFGFQAHEILWDVKDTKIRYPHRGMRITQTLAKAFVLRAINDLDPERVVPMVDQYGDLDGLRIDGFQWLPAEKCLMAINQLEWKNLHGTAQIDSSYIPWYHNNFFYLFLSRYLEQKGNPPLIGTAPWDSRFKEQMPLGANQTVIRTTEYLAQEMIALMGGGVCVLPWEESEKGSQMWSIKTLEVPQMAEQFLPVIMHNENLKLRGVLVPEHVATQDGNIGSYASSETHQDTFYGIMEILKNFLILGTINDGIIPLLIRYNFGKSAPVPVVTASELNRQSRALLADIIKSSIAIPRMLQDGRAYRISDIVDDIHALEALNIPHLAPEDVAVAPEKLLPDTGKPAPFGKKPGLPSDSTAGKSATLGGKISRELANARLAQQLRVARESIDLAQRTCDEADARWQAAQRKKFAMRRKREESIPHE